MNKKLTPQLLAMYLGCKVLDREGETGVLSTVNEHGLVDVLYGEHTCVGDELKNVTPILRPLSDMTEDELDEIEWDSGDWKIITVYEPDDFLYLLSKSFDLFGLIESGEAIETNKEEK